MPFALDRFTPETMSRCAAELRGLGAGTGSLEETAGRIVRYLHDQFRDPADGEPACALVRFFKTFPLRELGAELRQVAENAAPSDWALTPKTPCLTLLATAGLRPEWNDRRASAAHRAIPLPSPEIVARFPMIARLVEELGVGIRAVLDRDEGLLVERDRRTCNVFHVAEARGSRFVPAQDDFVVPCGVRSVLGFGGLLPPGDLFAVILFARVPVPRRTAELFRSLALSVKVALLDHSGRREFA